MVKVIGPALSLDASKTFGKTLTYQKRPSGSASYLYNKPGSREPFTKSPKQAVQRAKIGGLVVVWQSLSASLKDVWNETAKSIGYIGTGYHYFLHLGGIYPTIYSWSDSGVAWSDAKVGWSGYSL